MKSCSDGVFLTSLSNPAPPEQASYLSILVFANVRSHHPFPLIEPGWDVTSCPHVEGRLPWSCGAFETSLNIAWLGRKVGMEGYLIVVTGGLFWDCLDCKSSSRSTSTLLTRRDGWCSFITYYIERINLILFAFFIAVNIQSFNLSIMLHKRCTGRGKSWLIVLRGNRILRSRLTDCSILKYSLFTTNTVDYLPNLILIIYRKSYSYYYRQSYSYYLQTSYSYYLQSWLYTSHLHFHVTYNQ